MLPLSPVSENLHERTAIHMPRPISRGSDAFFEIMSSEGDAERHLLTPIGRSPTSPLPRFAVFLLLVEVLGERNGCATLLPARWVASSTFPSPARENAPLLAPDLITCTVYLWPIIPMPARAKAGARR